MKSLYLQLDWIIPQFIGEYIPLNEKQEQALKFNLQKTILWHRRTQLPEYVKWLHILQKDMQQELSETRVLQHVKQLQQYWKMLLIYLADDTADLLYSTSHEQRKQIFQTFAKKNAAYRKKYIELTDDVIRNNLLMQINDEYERWLGHIEPAQHLLFEQASKKLKPTGTLHLVNREVLQNELKLILNNTSSAEKFKSEINNLFSNWENLRSQEYRQTLEYNQEILLKLTSDISKTLNTEQKIYLNQKLESYIKLFTELRINNN